MKKNVIHLSIVAATFWAFPSFADVIVYGKANVSVQNSDESSYSLANGNQADGSKVELVSNASRIGIKGGEEVNPQLKVIYQFEYQTEVDDGTNGGQTFGQRNIYLGLQGAAGTVMGGHFDTPTKVAQEKIDLFNDLEGDITNLFKGENRASNIVQYTTPSFGSGFAASIAYVSEENDGTFKQSGTPTNGTSLSLGYTSAAFYAGIAADQDVEADGVDLVRAIARVTLGTVQLGVLAEQYENENTGADEDGALVSALWNVTDKWALKGQYGQSDVKWIDGTSASIGADYKLTKSATLFGYYTRVENGVEDIAPAEPITAADSDNYRDDTYLGVGIDFKF